jgi:hypothetical protein
MKQNKTKKKFLNEIKQMKFDNKQQIQFGIHLQFKF